MLDTTDRRRRPSWDAWSAYKRGTPAAAILAGGISRHGAGCDCRICADIRTEAALAKTEQPIAVFRPLEPLTATHARSQYEQMVADGPHSSGRWLVMAYTLGVAAALCTGARAKQLRDRRDDCVARSNRAKAVGK